jgi:hypothetical protein
MYDYIDQEGGPTKVVRHTPLEPPPPVVLPGVVVQEPDPDLKLIPYEKADRSPAGPLLALHNFTAEYLGISPELLVSLRGQITDRGSVAMFARNSHPGDAEPIGYVVASYDDNPDGGRLWVTTRVTRLNADAAYLTWLEAQA